jgi:branched-chain amino acid transport system substrate-binding protein
MRARRLCGTVGVAFVIALAAGCGGGDDDDGGKAAGGDAATGGGAGKTIKFLYSAPLTGDPTGSGQNGCAGAELAVKNINGDGGISKGPMQGAKLAIECVDDEFSTDVAATIANRYISDPDTWVLMGFTTSGQAAAAGHVAAAAQLPIVASNVSADFLTEDADNILVMAPRLPNQAAAEVDFCHEYFGGTKVANLNPDFSYIDELAKGEKAQIEELGMELVADERYKAFSQNFAPQLTSIKGTNPDCIMTGDFAPAPQQALIQARKLGIEAPFMDYCACGSAQAGLDVAKEDYIGFIIAEGVPFERPEGSLLEKIGTQWEDENGTRLSSYPAWSYDGVLTAVAAIEAGASKREEIIQHFADIDQEGLTTQLKFTDDLRPESTPLVFLEQTGPKLGDVEPVASYSLPATGTGFERGSVESCSKRPTCASAGG